MEENNFDRELDYPGQFVQELRIIHSASPKNKNEKVEILFIVSSYKISTTQISKGQNVHKLAYNWDHLNNIFCVYNSFDNQKCGHLILKINRLWIRHKYPQNLVPQY